MTDTTLTAEDRIEIHELLARRGYASDTEDVAAWVDTFTGDGVLEQPPVELDLPGGASAALTHTLDDPAAASERARKLRERVAASFTVKAMVDGVLEAYAAAMEAFHVKNPRR